jgi:hypothetical protein
MNRHSAACPSARAPLASLLLGRALRESKAVLCYDGQPLVRFPSLAAAQTFKAQQAPALQARITIRPTIFSASTIHRSRGAHSDKRHAVSGPAE